jgi:hypothetical protein
MFRVPTVLFPCEKSPDTRQMEDCLSAISSQVAVTTRRVLCLWLETDQCRVRCELVMSTISTRHDFIETLHYLPSLYCCVLSKNVTIILYTV